jgi:acetyl esterase/lipase
MKPLLFTLCTLLSILPAGAQTWQPSPGHTQIALWPGTPPDAVPGPDRERLVPADNPHDFVAGRPWLSIEQVTIPTMTVYSPKSHNTGVAIVVFPGGGYSILAIDLEGTEVCDWLTARGITCILLKYRVPDSGPAYHNDCQCNITPKAQTALEDAQRTLGLVRLHAAQWHIDPHKLGVLGFSAGGHLVANISTHFDHRAYTPIDAADQLSCRPDFAIAIYPGHMTEHTTHPFELNPTLPVTALTPPTFLLQNEDDHVDGVQQALTYYIALEKAHVPVEMHLYAQGGHAFGLRPTQLPATHWPTLVETWLQTLHILPPPPTTNN